MGEKDGNINTIRAKQVVSTYVSSLLNKEKEFKKLKKDVEAEASANEETKKVFFFFGF